MNQKAIRGLLLSLVVFDLLLVVWAFGFPRWWFVVFHGVQTVDDQSIALLQRCGANWFGFLIIQVVAYLKWREWPWLLVLVAGARLGDAFTDTTCLLVSPSRALLGILGFPLAGVGNIAAGLFLIRSYVSSLTSGGTLTQGDGS